MLLCCFRDAASDKDDDEPGQMAKKVAKTPIASSGKPNKTHGHVDVSEAVILAPITYHQPPMTSGQSVTPPGKTVLPPAYRSTSVSSSSISDQTTPWPAAAGVGCVQQRTPSRDPFDRRRDKERAPLNKEAKRLMKQRSQESCLNEPAAGQSIPYIDQSPTKHSTLTGQQDQSEESFSTHTSPLRQFAEERRRRSNGSTSSTPNLPTFSPTHQTNQASSIIAKPFQSSSNQLAVIEEKIQGRGMCRSSASYGIQQMLQDQISKDETGTRVAIEKEKSKLVAAYEERISAMRDEHNLKIQQLMREKTTAVNNIKNTLETDLQRRMSEFEKQNQSMHVCELQNLRTSHAKEIESMRKHYDKIAKENEEKYRLSILHYQERDQTWQTEKQEVLAEIQRLKEEASKFIAILSQEDEYEKIDQQLSPSKRQALTKEVESLQLVVEMRSSEIKQLREERTKLLEQLETYENTRNLLQKMSARVEDLQAQLEAKCQVERQLSLEKSQLENSFETESKNKERMSMQVEELQWRIKHNLDLPPTRIYSPGSPMSTDDTQWTEISGPMSIVHHQIHPFQEFHQNKSQTKEFFYNKNAVHYDVWKKGGISSSGDTKGFSLTSPPNIGNKGESKNNNVQSDPDPLTPTTVENNNQFASADDREKRDSSTEKQQSSRAAELNAPSAPDSLENLNHEDDEGLGDINHGSETSSSPQPILNHNRPSVTEGTDPRPPELGERGKAIVDSLSSPCDERVPSRIPFSLQTNL